MLLCELDTIICDYLSVRVSKFLVSYGSYLFSVFMIGLTNLLFYGICYWRIGGINEYGDEILDSNFQL